MSESLLLDVNPLTGETVTWEEHPDGSIIIGHHIDMQPLLEDNKRAVIEADHKKQVKKGWVKYAANITNVVVLKWKQEHNVDFFNEEDWPKVMALLNSREYEHLKTTTIRHDR